MMERERETNEAADSIGVPALDRAVRELRTNVPVREEWRSALLREVGASPLPSRATRNFFIQRRISISPIAAIAACLVAMAAGAGAMRALADVHGNDMPAVRGTAAASTVTTGTTLTT